MFPPLIITAPVAFRSPMAMGKSSAGGTATRSSRSCTSIPRPETRRALPTTWPGSSNEPAPGSFHHTNSQKSQAESPPNRTSTESRPHLLCAAGLVGCNSAIHAHIIDIHVGQAVIPGQIDGPAAARGQVDQEEQRALFGQRERLVAAHLDVVAIVGRVPLGDLAAVGVERLEPRGGDTE